MVEFIAQEFIKLKRTLTPSESAGSALSKNKTSEKNNRKTTTKHCETAQSAKRFPVESQIVSTPCAKQKHPNLSEYFKVRAVLWI